MCKEKRKVFLIHEWERYNRVFTGNVFCTFEDALGYILVLIHAKENDKYCIEEIRKDDLWEVENEFGLYYIECGFLYGDFVNG